MRYIAAALRTATWRSSIDALERMIAVALFGYLCSRMAQPILDQGDFIFLAIVLVELSIIFFMLFRKSASTVSLSCREWLIAGLGTLVPTLAGPSDPAPLVPVPVTTFLMLFGVTLQLHAKLTLRSSFGLVPANRGVKTIGPYVLVRHPIYLGYTLTHISFLLYAPNLWNTFVYSVGFIFQVIRIEAEERLLSADECFREYAKRVRYKLLPGVF